jgi:putative ABC transport system substrate-binding protein
MMAADQRGRHLSRRRFAQGAGLAGLGLLAGCGRMPGQAQPPPKTPRLGYLSSIGPLPDVDDAFRQGLRDYGYVENDNIVIEYRFADGHAERLSVFAAELAQLGVDLVVTWPLPGAQAAQAAMPTTPIVVPITGDPVGAGLVASLARPGGNITGLTSYSPELGAKRLELLKESVPGVSHLAVVWNGGNPEKRGEFRETEAAARVLGIQVRSVDVRGPEDLDAALEAVQRERVEAISVLVDHVTVGQQRRILDFASRQGLPGLYNDRLWVQAGGLMAYGAYPPALWRRAAYYVDRILKGARPADLPIEQPMTFDFVINLKTAQALGLTIPPHVLLQATEIIQ